MGTRRVVTTLFTAAPKAANAPARRLGIAASVALADAGDTGRPGPRAPIVNAETFQDRAAHGGGRHALGDGDDGCHPGNPGKVPRDGHGDRRRQRFWGYGTGHGGPAQSARTISTALPMDVADPAPQNRAGDAILPSAPANSSSLGRFGGEARKDGQDLVRGGSITGSARHVRRCPHP